MARLRDYGGPQLPASAEPRPITIFAWSDALAESPVTMLADMIARQRAGQAVEIPHRLLDFELIRRYSDGPPPG